MTELAKAYVQIVPSAQGIKGSITNALGGESEKAGRSAGEKVGNGLVDNIKKVVVAAGLGTLLKETFSAGADFEQNVGGIETLFGDGAQTMLEKSAEAYKTAGLSANDYMETVMSFSASLKQAVGDDLDTFTSISDMAVIDMADNANKMGTSMESIQTAYAGFAKQNYTMLDNLKLGYGGTKKEMERLLADASKLSGQKYDLDNLADVYNAIHVVQTELGITGTTSKEAEETFTGSMAAMKASASNVMSALATGGDVTGALDALLDSAITFFNNNMIPMLGKILGGLPDIVLGLLQSVMVELRIFSRQGSEFVDFAVNFATGLVESIVTITPYILEAFFNLVVSIGEALFNYDWIGTARKLIETLWDGMELAGREIVGEDDNFFSALFTKIQESLPQFLAQGVEIITNLVNGILSGLPELITMAGDLMVSFLDGWLSMLPSVWDAAVRLIENLVKGISDNLPNIVSSASTVITNFLKTILSHLPDIIQSGIRLLTALVTGILRTAYLVIKAILGIIVDVAKNFKDYDWASLGHKLIDGVVEGLKAMGSKIWEALKEIVGEAWEKVKGIFKKDKDEEEEAGEETAKNYAQGFAKGLQREMSALATDSTTAFNGQLIGGLNTSLNATATVTQNTTNNEMLNVLTEYLPVIAEKCGVTLGVNARGIFNVVREENNINTRATGRNALAY